MVINKAQNIRALDSYCINELKIPSIVLMENAALKVLKNIDCDIYNKIIIICGKGNNGGDALAVGRHLIAMGKNVEFVILGDGRGTIDYNINYDIIEKMNCSISNIRQERELCILNQIIDTHSLIIDGIFGTGLNREVSGIFKSVIELVNKFDNEVISIDIPSGLQSDTGEVLGAAIRANKTITFAMYKRGFFNYDALSYVGEVRLEEIGMPKIAIDKFDSKEYLVTEQFIRSNLMKRNILNHKGDFGRCLIFAGSRGFAGAAKIASKSAIKSGAGLVTVACSKEVENVVCSASMEAMCTTYDEECNVNRVGELIEKASSIAIGPGMGNNDVTLEILKNVLNKRKAPLVIDADGLNVLKGNLDLIKGEKENVVIMTPHLGEMSRITGLDLEYIKKNRIDVTKDFARTYNVIVVLKGYNTIITDGYSLYINTTGNSSMANGGMGDCLTGIISSFIGQKYDPMIATILSVYIHGFIGDRLSKSKFVVTAEDIINNLSLVVKELTV